jgi:hypothetical protein
VTGSTLEMNQVQLALPVVSKPAGREMSWPADSAAAGTAPLPVGSPTTLPAENTPATQPDTQPAGY